MATVNEIITDALQDLNVYGPGEAISAHDQQYCLRMLNKMISQWQTKKMMVMGQFSLPFNCNGQVQYTIGPGAEIDVPLPATVDSAFFRLTNIDYPVEVLTSYEDYVNITLKQIAGSIPTCIFYNRNYPTGIIYIWPQPSVGQVFLTVRDVLTKYVSMTDTITFSDDYALALQFSLEELIARTFGRTVTPDLKLDAKNARDVVMRNNLSIPRMGMPDGILSDGRFSIYTGQ